MAGECGWISGSSMLNSSLMTPTECVNLGGDCCNWAGSWNDGVGGIQQFQSFVGTCLNNFQIIRVCVCYSLRQSRLHCGKRTHLRWMLRARQHHSVLLEAQLPSRLTSLTIHCITRTKINVETKFIPVDAKGISGMQPT